MAWHEFWTLNRLWVEDGAVGESLEAAWQRLFKDTFPGYSSALDRADLDGCTAYLFPSGRVVVYSFDGHSIHGGALDPAVEQGPKKGPDKAEPIAVSSEQPPRENLKETTPDLDLTAASLIRTRVDWTEFWKLEMLWSEDDATLNDPTAEKIEGAWMRLFSVEFPGFEAAIGEADHGDCFPYLFEGGLVAVQSYDGHSIYKMPDSSETKVDQGAEPSLIDDEEMSEDQVLAIQQILAALDKGDRVLLLEGAAGTGKTWLMGRIACEFEARGYQIRYMAPTGKAALRLSKATGVQASTIHSALYKRVIDRDDGEPLFLDPKPLSLVPTVIIIDEASMVGRKVHQEILANTPDNSVVFYVGDPEQLEPVMDVWGPSFGSPTAKLDKVHRQALGNPILRIATELRNGGKLPSTSLGERFQCQNGSLADAAGWLIGQIETSSDAVCLAFTNKSRKGINKLVRHQLGFLGGDNIVVGERLVVLQNNPRIGCMNGETFVVERFTDVGGALKIRSDCGKVFYTHPAGIGIDYKEFEKIKKKYATVTDTRMWAHVDYGYCLTVHKSQGSEFDHVMFVLDRTMKFMARTGKLSEGESRRLCYTALTRAKETFFRLDVG